MNNSFKKLNMLKLEGMMALSEHTIALQADNGKYLSQINISGLNYIKPDKTDIDVFCQFKLITLFE
ncbi:hypothetical protein [Photorhabdus sp. SF281]|uniref:hypothetical protein n=1 Tax=Photorhabdus sp. SF281 TaxID=3459527 RepID=UPI0040446565